MHQLSFVDAHALIEDSIPQSCDTPNDLVRTRILHLSGRTPQAIRFLTPLLCKNPSLTDGQLEKQAKIENIPLDSHKIQATYLRNSPTPSEKKILDTLILQMPNAVSRDMIAQTLWGSHWIERYSEWDISAHIHNLRRKLHYRFTIRSVRSFGYILEKKHHQTLPIPHLLPVSRSPGKLPPSSYIRYMNSPSKIRKTLKDMCSALQTEGWMPRIRDILRHTPSPRILVINSYSTDNIDAIASWKKRVGNSCPVYFSHFDERALLIHQKHIADRGIAHIFTLSDDIRRTRIEASSMTITINDFRLNFNTDDRQNRDMLEGMYRVTRPGGLGIISAVVDARYEHPRYGAQQSRAPLHVRNPGTFEADEHFQRFSWTIPYYERLFRAAKWQSVSMFDTAQGAQWANAFKKTHPLSRPYYRRWILQK